MNPAHLHLLVNHLPIIGFLFAIPLLLLTWLRKRESGLALAAAVMLLMSGGGTAAAYLTGEGAEEQIEHQPGIAETYINVHEDAAKWAIPVGLLASLSGAALLFAAIRINGDQPVSATPLLVATVSGVLATATMAYIGSTGGKISHPEARASSLTSGLLKGVQDENRVEFGSTATNQIEGEERSGRGRGRGRGGDDDD